MKKKFILWFEKTFHIHKWDKAKASGIDGIYKECTHPKCHAFLSKNSGSTWLLYECITRWGTPKT